MAWDSYTKLVLHMDGADASTTFTDEIGHTFTAAGNAQIDTAKYKFETASGLFDGTGDYIDTDDHADFDVGSGEFTVDFWVYRNATGNHRVCGQAKSDGTVANLSFGVGFDASHHVIFMIGVGASLYTATSTGTITADSTWHHIACVRDNTSTDTLRIFIDGVADGTVAVDGLTANNSAYKFAIGRFGEYADLYFNGWIDEFRFLKGKADWTSNFTPPTQEYQENVYEVSCIDGLLIGERLSEVYEVSCADGIELGECGREGETVESQIIYTSDSDGWIESWDYTYNTAWVDTTGTPYDGENDIFIGQAKDDSDRYHIYRGFVYFDTSSIPLGATIVSAILSLYGIFDISIENDFLIMVQNGQPIYPHGPMVSGDYDKTNYNGDGGSLNTSGFVVGAYNPIPLTSDGLSWIQKGAGAITKLCLRSSRDIAGLSPPSGVGWKYESVSVESYLGVSDHKPKLYIEYYRSPSVTKTVGCSLTDGVKVGDTTSMLNQIQRALTDGLTLGDAALRYYTAQPTATDGLKLGDALSTLMHWYPALTDGAELGDITSAQRITWPALTDGLTLGDTASMFLTIYRALTDGLVLADEALRYYEANPTATDGLLLGEAAILYLAAIARLQLLIKDKARMQLIVDAKARMQLIIDSKARMQTNIKGEG